MDPNIPPTTNAAPVSPIQPVTPPLTQTPVVPAAPIAIPVDRSFGKRFFGNRINRLQYITGLGVCLGILMLLGLILPFIVMGIARLLGLSSTAGSDILTFVIYLLMCPFSIFYSISLIVRRLHDSNKSGWLWLLTLIPIVNLYLVYSVFLVDSDEGDNKYGPKPPEKMPLKEIFGF